MELSKDELVELKADSMDDSEIKMQDKDIKIIVYNDLKDYKTIDELLPKKKDYIILLYQTEAENSGHTGSPYVVIMIIYIILIVMESLQTSPKNGTLKI